MLIAFGYPGIFVRKMLEKFKKINLLTTNKNSRKPQKPLHIRPLSWSECRDLNPGPLGPEPSAIPNFATPRNICRYFGGK